MRKLFISIAGRKGIKVVIDRECKTPFADAKGCITLPPPSAEDPEKFWLYAFHELGHLLKELTWSYKEINDYLNLEDKLSMTVLNIIMDNLCEKNFFGEYEGVDDALANGRGVITKDYCAKKNSEYVVLEKDPVQSLMWGLIWKDAGERQDWMGYSMECLPIEDKIDNVLPFIMKELDGIHFVQRLKAILAEKNPAEFTGQLVLDILGIIGHSPPPPAKDGDCKKCGGTGKDKDGSPCDACSGTGKEACEECGGEGEGEDGKPCEACDGTGDKKVEGDTGDGEGKGTDTLKESKENHADGIGRPDAPDWTHDPSDMSEEVLAAVIKGIDERMGKPIIAEEMESTYLDPWGRGGGKYIPWDTHRVIPVDATEPQPYVQKSIEHALGTSTVSKSISKYLKAMVSESYTYGQRRGRIHQKNVHRVISGAVQAGSPPAIYKKKNQSTLKHDSAVTILLDCSGSMSGSKYAIGSACCVALSETLQGLGVQHEILGFTETNGLVTYIMKEYGVPMTKEKMLRIMASGVIRQSNNADGESVMYAAERLLSRKESRKLMVVLSDGHPAGRFVGDGHAYLRKICRMIEQTTPVDLVGIGIQTNAVREFYKHHVVVNNPNQLDAVLFGVLKDFLL